MIYGISTSYRNFKVTKKINLYVTAGQIDLDVAEAHLCYSTTSGGCGFKVWTFQANRLPGFAAQIYKCT
jgi:hypothetical protein